MISSISERGTDSTIAPSENQRFFLTNVSWLFDTRMDDINERSPHIFLCTKVYGTITSGFKGTPYLRR